jgi:hypothetical protein
MQRRNSMKGWLVIGACVLGIVAFIALIWAIGTFF